VNQKRKPMDVKSFKKSIYKEMADVTKALGNPNRLEILDLLAQGSCSVEYIADQTNLSVANASQHLQVLKNAKLVATERKGKYSYYQLANSHVFNTWCSLRRLALSQNAEISHLIDDFRRNQKDIQTISSDDLIKKMETEDIMIIDVRPEEEYKKGHIRNAICFPKDMLDDNMKNLDKSKQIIAYCRGPFCMLADEAVEMLKQKGYKAARLENGYPDWEARELPVEESAK
jgi:rhodanese-related sulfurtransferase/biotin operon repressor